MKAITDKNSAEFIPVENRIAVFDMDGTLCCDDTERENGNVEKAGKMRASCEENGYTAISMKNDWTTIYGDGVTRK